jgi:hypothetical protein
MADNAGRAGHGWTIGGAFAAQAVIIAGIATLLGGTSSGPVMSASAGPAPAVAAPAQISLLPVITMQNGDQASGFPFMLSIDGQGGTGFFQDGVPTPLSYTVAASRDLTVKLGVTISPKVSITNLWLTLAAAGQAPQEHPVYVDLSRPLSPGQHTFTASWPGTARELQPGTTWTILMSANSPGVYMDNDGAIATVTVGS